MKLNPNHMCLCCSTLKYKKCCRPLHQGQAATSASALMRARYCAYATGEVGYILLTTDPAGPHFQHDHHAWWAEVSHFSATTQFVALEVLRVEPGEEVAYVTFRARMVQATGPTEMVERSRFTRVAGRWLYHSGTEPLPTGAGPWLGSKPTGS